MTETYFCDRQAKTRSAPSPLSTVESQWNRNPHVARAASPFTGQAARIKPSQGAPFFRHKESFQNVGREGRWRHRQSANLFLLLGTELQNPSSFFLVCCRCVSWRCARVYVGQTFTSDMSTSSGGSDMWRRASSSFVSSRLSSDSRLSQGDALACAEPDLIVSMLTAGSQSFGAMRQAFQSASPEWMLGFLQLGGLESLFSSLQLMSESRFTNDAGESLLLAVHMLEGVMCAKAVMNNKDGLDYLIDSGDDQMKSLTSRKSEKKDSCNCWCGTSFRCGFGAGKAFLRMLLAVCLCVSSARFRIFQHQSQH